MASQSLRADCREVRTQGTLRHQHIGKAMRRVHLLGGGSLGTLFASHFARAGVDPILLLRPSAAKIAGRHCTVRVTTEDDDNVSEHTIQCESTDDAGRDAFDILIVATKAYDVRSALTDVRARLHTSSTVILLCNGALAVADELPQHGGPLMAATSTHGAWSRGKRDVHHAGNGETWIGAYGKPVQAKPSGLFDWLVGGERVLDAAETPAAAEAQRFFASHGLGAHVENPSATERRLWLKLAANAVLNPLTALWDCQNGQVLSRAEGRETARAVCEEIASVAAHVASDGSDLSTDALVDFVHECAAANALNFSSMCMDVRHGRRTEIEQLNGWVAKKGYELGLTQGSTSGNAWLGKNEELADAIRARHPE